VHVYTSPHLVKFHERIRIGAVGGGHFIEDDDLAEALLQVERVNDGQPITQFEITTAAALRLFAERPADYTLLEVGLGGRLDATNVVQEPLATIITPVAMDHEKFLGDRIELIAAEKAGILKRGRPAIVAPQMEAAFDVIEKTAARLQAPLFVANQDWVAYAEHGRMVYQDERGLLDLPAPRLIGRHQYANAGTAVAALRRAGIALVSAAIESGLTGVEWPARMQLLTEGRIVAAAPAGSEIWLDGGHNPSAGAAVAETLADLEERLPRPVDLVIGMLNTKDTTGYLQPFKGIARRIIAVPVPSSPAGRDPEEIVAAAAGLGIEAQAADSVEAALADIVSFVGSGPAPRILIGGSLYLAGTVLALNGSNPR